MMPGPGRCQLRREIQLVRVRAGLGLGAQCMDTMTIFGAASPACTTASVRARSIAFSSPGRESRYPGRCQLGRLRGADDSDGRAVDRSDFRAPCGIGVDPPIPTYGNPAACVAASVSASEQLRGRALRPVLPLQR
jgi:hypothetical protein